MRGAVVLVLLVGCSGPARHDADAAAPVLVDAAPPVVDAGLPPLAGDWLTALELPDRKLAYVAPPLGATEVRPVIVAVHGAADNPGYMCSAWRVIVDAYAFVVCPSGTRVGKDTFTWSSAEHISAAIDTALAAARARFPGRIADTPLVYAAFSQGATLGAYAIEHGHFARAALTEGGYHAFEGAQARAFVKAGGQRVLYTCAQGGCVGSFGASKAALAAAGVEVRVESPGPFGHSLTPPVRASINASLPWLVADLPGWEGYAAAPKLASH